jgi:hypothetical protein
MMTPMIVLTNLLDDAMLPEKIVSELAKHGFVIRSNEPTMPRVIDGELAFFTALHPAHTFKSSEIGRAAMAQAYRAMVR